MEGIAWNVKHLDRVLKFGGEKISERLHISGIYLVFGRPAHYQDVDLFVRS